MDTPFSLINGQRARMKTPILPRPMSSPHRKGKENGKESNEKWHLLANSAFVASAPTQKPPYQEGTRKKSRLHLV